MRKGAARSVHPPAGLHCERPRQSDVVQTCRDVPPVISRQAKSGPQLTEEEGAWPFPILAAKQWDQFRLSEKCGNALGRLNRLHAAAAVYDAGELATTRIEVDAVAGRINLTRTGRQDLCAASLGDDSIGA